MNEEEKIVFKLFIIINLIRLIVLIALAGFLLLFEMSHFDFLIYE